MNASYMFLAVTCITAPFLILGIIFIVIARNMRHKSAASQSWPTTPGTVTSATVEETHSSDFDGPSTSYHPRIAYSYQVVGTAYESRKLSFGAVSSSSRGSAEKALEAYPPGKAVVVHYNPENPAEAVLVAEAGGTSVFMIVGIILTVIAVMIGCAGIAITYMASITA